MAPSYYEYAYAVSEEGLSAVMGLLSGLPSVLLGIAGYVLTALALYTLAKRRGINHPWLSWVPVANSWIIGSLSDQYRYVVKGENRSKRKSLLILKGINIVISVGMLVLIAGAVFAAIEGSMYGYYREEDLLADIMGPLLGVVGLAIPLLGVAIAGAVIRYMALYDIYTSMDPGNNVLFLVLSILFSVTEPFFLFFNRKKDLGMPPRRQTCPTPPVQEEPWTLQEPQRQSPEEPWEDKDYL